MHRQDLTSSRGWTRVSLAWLLACAGFLCTGCGDDLPEVAPVRGVVEYEGKPLSGFQNAAVAFTPEAGRPATGTVSPQDGSFELTTYSRGDGARVGRHAVAVSATVDDPTVQAEDKYPGVRSIIPEKLANRDTSGLTYEVKPQANVIRIHIRSDGTGTIVEN